MANANMELAVVVHPEPLQSRDRRRRRGSTDSDGTHEVALRVGHGEPSVAHAFDEPGPQRRANRVPPEAGILERLVRQDSAVRSEVGGDS